MKLTRRSVVVGAGALAALPVPALAQEKVVRFGISMADEVQPSPSIAPGNLALGAPCRQGAQFAT